MATTSHPHQIQKNRKSNVHKKFLLRAIETSDQEITNKQTIIISLTRCQKNVYFFLFFSQPYTADLWQQQQ